MNPVILADNRFLDGTPTATDTAAGYNVLNIRDLKTYTFWKAASAGTKYITVDCGALKVVDALAIGPGHNLHTVGATVSVESAADLVGPWTVRLAAFAPISDKSLLKLMESATARCWRIKIVAPTGAPKIAVALLGERIDFPYPPETPYKPIQSRVESESNRSKTGQLLGIVVRYKSFTITPEWRMVPRSFIEDYIVPFYDDYASNGNPFFFAWDLGTYPNDVRFVSLSGDMSFDPDVSVLPYYDSFRLSMEGVRE